MVKVASYQFLDKLGAGRVDGVLLYGQNRGLVDILEGDAAKKLLGAEVAGYVRLSGEVMQGDRDVLMRELEHASLFGGDRVVSLRDADDKLADWIEKNDVWGRKAPGCTLMLWAGELSPRSRLRKLFEDGKNIYSVACYDDDERSKSRKLSDMLRGGGVVISEEGRDYVLSRLSSDSSYNRSQIEKLILLAGTSKRLSDRDVLEACESGDMIAFDELLDKSFAGRKFDLVESLKTLQGNDTGFDISLLRSCQRHVDKLHTLLRLLGEGRSFKDAAMMVKPRIFFKREGIVESHCRLWNRERLRAVSGMLLESERRMKEGVFGRVTLERVLLQISNLSLRK